MGIDYQLPELENTVQMCILIFKFYYYFLKNFYVFLMYFLLFCLQ